MPAASFDVCCPSVSPWRQCSGHQALCVPGCAHSISHASSANAAGAPPTLRTPVQLPQVQVSVGGEVWAPHPLLQPQQTAVMDHRGSPLPDAA